MKLIISTINALSQAQEVLKWLGSSGITKELFYML